MGSCCGKESSPRVKRDMRGKITLALRTRALGLQGEKLRRLEDIELSEEQKGLLHSCDLSNNLFSELQMPFFTAFAGLKTLKINDCEFLTVLPTFPPLPALRALEVRHCHLQSVGDLPKGLKSIDFSENNLTFVSSSSFADLAHLQTLSLSSNRLESLVVSGEFPCLRELLLDNNLLREVAVTGGLLRLQLLSLKVNSLTAISKEVLLLPQLHSLRLGGNPLTKSQLLQTAGFEEFEQRRQAHVKKGVDQKAMTSTSLCGLD